MNYSIETAEAEQFVDITSLVQEEVTKSRVSDGIAVVFVPHTTAGITINENADRDVVRDTLYMLDKVCPVDEDYRHMEGNSHAHIKASLMGSSVNVIIEDGRLKLGTWQGIYFCEFDGPRKRKIYTHIIES